MVTSAGRLLERERELERIGALLDRARAGDGGSVLVVEGPAGIGKTRLARAARQEAELRGFYALGARGTELEHAYPFGVVRQLFESTVRAASDEGRAVLLHGAAALAEPAVLPEAGRSSDEIDPAFGALHGLYWLCANLCVERPVLLAVDDLQWVDRPSLDFLGFLAHRIDTLPVVLLVARRSGTEIGSDIEDDAEAEHLELRPLSEAGVTSFLRLLADGPVDAQFARACERATGGNPFLLDQVSRALLERDVAFVSESIDLVETIGPEAVAAGVRARLARVDDAAAAFARAAAILGDDTPLVVAAGLADLDEASAAAAASTLVRASVLEDSRPLRFVHPLVRAAVEAGMSSGARAALHRRAAELLAGRGASSAEVAVHLLATEPGADSWTLETLLDAAHQAVGQGAPGSAVPMLTRALAEAPALDQRFQLLLELGRAESALGLPAAAEHLREAHRIASGPLERGRAALALAWSRSRGEADGRPLRELVVEAIDAVNAVDGDLALELEAAYAALIALQPNGAAEHGHELERFADLEGRTAAECSLLAQLAQYRMDMGRSAREAVGLAERAVANPDIVSRAAFDAPWLLSAVLVLRQAEDTGTARRTLDIALAAAKRRGSIFAYALASTLRGDLLLRTGSIRDAEADAHAALEAAPQGSWASVPAVAILVETLVERNALAAAQHILAVNDAAGDLPDIRPATVLLISRAALSLARDEPRAALADLQLARARLDRFGRHNIVGLDGRIRTILALHAVGDANAARSEAEAAVEVAQTWGTHAAIGTALRGLAVAAEAEERIALLDAAVDHLEHSQRRLEHARALVDLGGALRRRGDRVAARKPLRQALDVALAGSGTAVAERAREELRAAGVSVRREHLTGLDSLTPSERRVVERAAAGASNRDIAQALFVTVKTVEMHLGHAYRKLGIASRAELADHIEPSPSPKNRVEV